VLKPIFVLALITFFSVGAAVADICVRDDSGADVCLSKPAQRIIALSPGATELIYAAGGGDQVIAAVSYCDYPEAAKALPRVGSYNRFDQEAILAQKPDLLIAWIEGNPAEQLAKLKSLGLTIYYTQLNDFDDVSSSLGQTRGG
jgi:iron complex transport system substrate-binding protein